MKSIKAEIKMFSIKNYVSSKRRCMKQYLILSKYIERQLTQILEIEKSKLKTQIH